MKFAISRQHTLASGGNGRTFGTFEADTKAEAVAAAIEHHESRGEKVRAIDVLTVDEHEERRRLMHAAESRGEDGADAAKAWDLANGVR